MKPLTKLYIPRDTTACSLGADDVARRVLEWVEHTRAPVDVVRNGSRGLYWLEPMLEIDTARGRVAYGPVSPDRVGDFLTDDGWRENPEHPLYLGLTEEIPYLKHQQRLTFARVGVIDPLAIGEYRDTDGFTGLRRALALSPQEIVTMVTDSGLRGRGGAAFPTGIKWQTVLDTRTDGEQQQKYIVCNADEGDSGTFADRMIMESDPFTLLEGMTIAGLAVGASQGYIYLREEYRLAEGILRRAIHLAVAANYLGDDIQGSGQRFHIDVRLGAGAYICGEETALLESIEGKRGMVRAKPPLPAIQGLWQQPTVINNVITLATVPVILSKGAACYADFGLGRSRGTIPVQLAGNVNRAGLVELAFGPSLNRLLNEFGNGTRTGRPIKAVQVGGPLGAYLPENLWSLPLDYEAFASQQAVLGHGGIVVFDDSVDMGEQAEFSMEFCALESCGKCTPCRIGSTRGVETIRRIRSGVDAQANTTLLEDLCDTLEHSSLCAMGGMTPYPVRSALRYFASDFASDSLTPPLPDTTGH